MKICLINPPSPLLLEERVFPSLGLLSVAASLRQNGHEVYVEDVSGLSDCLEPIRKLPDGKWDCYAVTSTTPQWPSVVAIAEVLREIDPGKKLIIGGPHPTVMPESCGNFDVVVRGDGEDAILEAIKPGVYGVLDYATNIQKGPLKYTLPARDLIDLDSYKFKLGGRKGTSILTEAGCPFNSPDEMAMIALPTALIRPIETKTQGITVCEEGHRHRMASFGLSEFVEHQDEEACITITTTHGFRLTVTPEHKVLCLQQGTLTWKASKYLDTSDWVVIGHGANTIKNNVQLPPPDHQTPGIPVITPRELTGDLGWIIGFFIGNGSYLDGSTQGLSFVVNAHLTERQKVPLIEKLKLVFGIDPHIYHQANTKGPVNVAVHSIAVFEFFRQSLHVVPGDKLHVPLCIRQSPPEIVDAFLQGLWAADGHWSKGRDSYLTTASRDFAEEVALVGLWAGIPLHVRKGTISGFSEALMWRVVRCRQECLERSLGKPCWAARINGGRPQKSYGRVYSDRKTSTFSRARLSGLDPKSELLKHWFDEVESVVDAGPKRVYSISNHPSHKYSANGVVISNCSFCCGRSISFYRRVRYRNPDDIVSEMVGLRDRYGITGFMDFSDEINLNSGTLVAFARKLKPYDFKLRAFIKANLFTDEQAEAMAEGGFVECCTGVEGGSDRILGIIDKQTTRQINKNFVDLCHKYGMRAKAFMSIGHAGENLESAMAIKDWLLWARPDDFDVTTITVYPATPYWDKRVYVETDKNGNRVCKYVKMSKNSEENGATLFFEEVDYSKSFAFYKGRPSEYVSHVWTNDLSKEDLVRLRDQIEDDVRKELNIPYPKRYSGDYLNEEVSPFDSSMGQPSGHLVK